MTRATTSEHSRLVALGAKWLCTRGFPVVATELRSHGSREQPDVVGFRSTCSCVIECKTSRSDFIADRKKPERSGARAIGTYRLYLAQTGLISLKDVPAGWGILSEVDGEISQVLSIMPTGNLWPIYGSGDEEWLSFQHISDIGIERDVLFSIARRRRDVESGV